MKNLMDIPPHLVRYQVRLSLNAHDYLRGSAGRPADPEPLEERMRNLADVMQFHMPPPKGGRA